MAQTGEIAERQPSASRGSFFCRLYDQWRLTKPPGKRDRLTRGGQGGGLHRPRLGRLHHSRERNRPDTRTWQLRGWTPRLPVQIRVRFAGALGGAPQADRRFRVGHLEVTFRICSSVVSLNYSGERGSR